jgi:polyadenylation factor subunit 2
VQVKLWDPKAGKCVYSIHGHKNAVTSVQWNNNGNWLLTGSRDQLCRVFDIRMMRALAAYKGQNREVSSVTWHPHHEELFVSGGMDGSLMHWCALLPSPCCFACAAAYVLCRSPGISIHRLRSC